MVHSVRLKVYGQRVCGNLDTLGLIYYTELLILFSVVEEYSP